MPSYGGLTVPGLSLEELARFVADVTNGHDHDGVNSKAVAAATVAEMVTIGEARLHSPEALRLRVSHTSDGDEASGTNIAGEISLVQTQSTTVVNGGLVAWGKLTATTGTPTGHLFGLEALAQHAGSVTQPDVRGLRGVVWNSSTGTITLATSIRAENVLNTGGGTVVTAVGLYVEAQTVGGTNYAIYTAGTTETRLGGPLTVAAGVGTADASIEVGTGRTGSGYAFFDLVGDTTYSDYGLRLIRGNAGVNATSDLLHRGTGTFTIRTVEAGTLALLSGKDLSYDAASAQAHVFKVATTTEVTVDAAGINLASGNVYKVNGTQVVGAQGAAITDTTGDAAGPTYTSTEQGILNNHDLLLYEILARLVGHGLIAA